MADSIKRSFSKVPILNIFFQKIHGLFFGLVGLIHAKGVDVAQQLWPSGSPTLAQIQAKNAFFCLFRPFLSLSRTI